MKKLLLVLLLTTNAFAFEDCEPSKVICKSSPCSVAVVKSLGSLGMASCSKKSYRHYNDFTGEYTFLYYEIELISTLEGDKPKTIGNILRIKELSK